jgi:hypothetical protein
MDYLAAFLVTFFAGVFRGCLSDSQLLTPKTIVCGRPAIASLGNR